MLYIHHPWHGVPPAEIFQPMSDLVTDCSRKRCAAHRLPRHVASAPAFKQSSGTAIPWMCVLSERPISHGDILVRAIPIGGLRMIDRGQADDKNHRCPEGRMVSSPDNYQVPPALLDRLRHYFLTYKEVPGESGGVVEIAEVYGRRAAHDTINRSREDYRAAFPNSSEWLASERGDEVKLRLLAS